MSRGLRPVPFFATCRLRKASITMITTTPRPRDAHPATVPGGFSHDRHPAAGAPHGSPPPAAACSRVAPFLAPPTAEEQKPAPRESDCDEVAMHRLRHPFTVAAGTMPEQTVSMAARVSVSSQSNRRR